MSHKIGFNKDLESALARGYLEMSEINLEEAEAALTACGEALQSCESAITECEEK